MDASVLNSNLYSTLNKYFNTLKYTGYFSYESTKQLIMYDFFQEMLKMTSNDDEVLTILKCFGNYFENCNNCLVDMQIIINCCKGGSSSSSVISEYAYFGLADIGNNELTEEMVANNSTQYSIGDTLTIKKYVKADTMWVAIPKGHTLEQFYIEGYENQDFIANDELSEKVMTIDNKEYTVYYYHLRPPLKINNSYIVVIK